MTAYREDLREVALAGGQVANYCDHADHNEVVDGAWVLGAGETLRTVALRIAGREKLDIFELYAQRLSAIEARSVAADERGYDGPAAARSARTWRELQLVQLNHDRHYHPDVLGLHKSEQLRHYALHITKLVAALAEEPSPPAQHDDFIRRRLPDMLLFGIKLTTVMGTRLPDNEFDSLYVTPSASLTLA